jgi:hypothetical protein
MNAQMFEHQATTFLRDCADQFLCKVPKGQPGILAIFSVDKTGQQMGYRWLSLENIPAAIALGTDPLNQFLSDMLHHAQKADRKKEVPMAVLSSDFTKCMTAMVHIKPVKTKQYKGFKRRPKAT